MFRVMIADADATKVAEVVADGTYGLVHLDKLTNEKNVPMRKKQTEEWVRTAKSMQETQKGDSQECAWFVVKSADADATKVAEVVADGTYEHARHHRLTHGKNVSIKKGQAEEGESFAISMKETTHDKCQEGALFRAKSADADATKVAEVVADRVHGIVHIGRLTNKENALTRKSRPKA